jgi:histidinol-phosphate aminotransferase
VEIARISRRNFGQAVGAALGGILLDTRLAPSVEAAVVPAAAGRPIRLSSNENPYGPSENARRAAVEATTRFANRYPDDLAQEARRSIADHHGVKVDQVALGCGSSQIIQMADAGWLGAGKTVVASEPTFEAVLAYAAVIHAEAVKVPQTADFRHDLAKMAGAVNERTGLVYVCNPNNPTGTIVTGNDLAAFVARVPPSALILVDEAYHHFVENPRYRSALELAPRTPNLVVARTFSKIYGLAGMRLGYAVGSPSVIARLNEYASWDNVNAAVLAAARASLEDRELVPQRRKTLNGTRRWLCGELSRGGHPYIPSEANFVMINTHGDVAPVIQAFRQRGIHVGRRFASMPNWLRISIGRREEMEAFASALREIVPRRA